MTPDRPPNHQIAFLLVALTGLWAAWCDTALLWDGAYQLCQTLLTGRPFFYLSRFHSWLLWLPVVWLAPHTGSMALLKFLYALPFSLAPLASVVLSWWVVRRQNPHLMLWALLGAVSAPLPGQIFMINDSIFQLHFFWPVFLGALVPLTRAQVAVLGPVSLFQLSHPVGIGLCGAMVLATGVAARVGRPERRAARWGWCVWLALLAAGGLLKLRLWPDPYAASEATWEQVRNTFLGGVAGWPVAGLAAAWVAAALLLREGARLSPRTARRAGLAAVGLLALGGALWLWWAADPWRWRGALNYRRWVAPMSAPFFLAAAWELWRGEQAGLVLTPAAWRARGWATLAAAVVYLAVFGTQAAVCRALFSRLGREIAQTHGDRLEERRLGWTVETALGHWGLSAQVIVAQGQHPPLLLWNEAAAAAAAQTPPAIAFSTFDFRPPSLYPQSWFDWSRIPASADR